MQRTERARCPTPAFVEINEQSPRLKITSSPAAASVASSHFPVDINAASTAQRELAWTKNSLNRQLPIFKLAFSARLRAFRVRSSSPVGWNPPSTLTARRGPSAPQPSSAARRRILDARLLAHRSTKSMKLHLSLLALTPATALIPTGSKPVPPPMRDQQLRAQGEDTRSTPAPWCGGCAWDQGRARRCYTYYD